MPTTGIDRPNQTKTLWILTAAVATGLIAAMFIPGIGTTLILVQVGFLVLHGAWRYGWRAIAVFAVAGLVISNRQDLPGAVVHRPCLPGHGLPGVDRRHDPARRRPPQFSLG